MRRLNRHLIGAASPLALVGGAGRSLAAEIDVVVSIKPVHSLVAGVMQGVGARAPGQGDRFRAQLQSAPVRSTRPGAGRGGFLVGETMETFLIKPLRALASEATVVELWETPA